MNKYCDIVIPVYNSPDWLMLCVKAAIMSDKSECIRKIILVDDCSNEDTKKCLKKLNALYYNIELLENKQNLGFVKTCNKGMKHTVSEYIMLLNSDCLLAEDTTYKLIKHMKHNKEIGLICPLSNNAANLSIDIPKNFNYIKFDKLLEAKFNEKNFPACTIVGNCMIISRACYEKIGGLDESYGMGYGEETDYQFKAAENNFKAIVAIDTFVFHKSQMSFGDGEVLNERKQKNLQLFLSRWGYEYQECLKEYTKNDPVKYVLSHLKTEDYKKFYYYKSNIFSQTFIKEVINLDRKYNQKEIKKEIIKITKQHKLNKLINKTLKIQKEQGTKVVLKKAKSYFLNKAHISVSKNIDNICKEKNVNYKDVIFIIENKYHFQRAKILKEELEFNGLFSDIISIKSISPHFLKCYKSTIFVNCKVNKEIEKYVKKAQQLNKGIFWVIDKDFQNKFSNENINYIKLISNGIITNEKTEVFTDKVYIDQCKLLVSQKFNKNLLDFKISKKPIKIAIIKDEELENILNSINNIIIIYYNLNNYNEIAKNIDIIIINFTSKNINKKELWIKNSINGIITLFKNEIKKENFKEIYTTNTECKETIENLLNHEENYNKWIKENYNKVYELYNTQNLGYNFTKFIKEHQSTNIAFVLPSIIPCGGVNVVIKHCEVLQENGYDVFIINLQENEEDIIINNRTIPIISDVLTNIFGFIDKVVTTMWITNKYAKQTLNFSQYYYLVQGYETNFYSYKDMSRFAANATYSMENINYLTVSKWCEQWLKNTFEREVIFIPNGIATEQFKPIKREFKNKIKILVEGDPESKYKNIDESFRITNKLNPDKFEIIFMSNAGHPKSWYRVDKFYSRISHQDTIKVYQDADILIKSSILESFSYPPLEMMSTGGLVVAVQNEGNKEYLKDNINCLIYRTNHINEALECIYKLLENKELRDNLVKNGIETANQRNWTNIRKDIINAYK